MAKQQPPKDIDFAELRDGSVAGEELQALTDELLRRLGHRTERGGRGADGGRDLYCYEVVSGDLVALQRRWLVQCKDFAKSGRAVNEGDIGDVTGQCSKHAADGYLLVTTTTVTSEVAKQFEAYNADRAAPFVAAYLDEHRLRQFLGRSGFEAILRQFLPQSAERVRNRQGNYLRGYLEERGVPSGVLDQVMAEFDDMVAQAVAPSGAPTSSTLFPFATAHRDTIDLAAEHFEKDELQECANEMMKLPFEEWSALSEALAARNEDSARQVLEILAEESPDEPQRFAAINALADFVGADLSDLIPHMTGLSQDSLGLLVERHRLETLVRGTLEKHVVEHEPRDLDDLPAHMTQGISISDVRFSLEDGDAIAAEVDFDVELEITADGGEEYSPYSLSGTAQLMIRGTDDVEVQSVSVSTRAFFGEAEEEVEPPDEE